MATVRIRFVTSRDPISWIIRAAEMGFLFSHVETIMPDGSYLGAHADGGVLARPAGYDAAYEPIETIVEVPCTQAQADAFHAFLRAQLGKPYDMCEIRTLAGHEAWASEAEILADLTVFKAATPDRWICSGLTDDAAEVAGILPPLPFKPQARTPRDVYMRFSALVPIGLPVPALQPQSVEIQARPV